MPRQWIMKEATESLINSEFLSLTTKTGWEDSSRCFFSAADRLCTCEQKHLKTKTNNNRIVHLEVGGAGCGFTTGGGDPAGVLTAVPGNAVGQLQAEQVVLLCHLGADWIKNTPASDQMKAMSDKSRLMGQSDLGPTLSLSASLSSSCALSLSQVAVTPAPLLATASNTTFSPARKKRVGFISIQDRLAQVFGPQEFAVAFQGCRLYMRQYT